MNSAQEIWDRVLAILGKTKTQTTLSTWFDDAEPVALTENYFILCIPVPFKRDVVTNRFLDDIRDALYELFSAHLEVMIISAEEKERYTQQKTDPQRLFPGTENYTFERFVVGNSNKFAHAAAQAVASMPGRPTIPCSSMGTPAWARPICSTPLPTRSTRASPPTGSSTSGGTPSPMS